MGWTNWPPATGDDIQAWDFIKEAYYALRERAWATGSEFWPRTNLAWASGTLTGATNTSLTDSSADFGGTGSWPFDIGTTDISAWDVIIDAGDNTDPRLVVRAAVSSWTSTTLTIGSIADTIAQGIISGASSLVGKRYFLIKSGGLWWNDRWMDWPNDELDHGTASSATTASLTQAGRQWTVDQWAAKELVTHTAADGAQRVTIVSNTADTLTFSTQTWTPSGAYSIVPVGGIAIPGRTPGAIYKWYGGATRNFYSHYPDDTLAQTALPALTVRYSSGTGGAECTDVDFDVFDIDWWSGVDEECSTKDKSYAPDLFQTIRGLQVGTENFVTSFIDPDRTYDGSSGAIRNFTTAEWFDAAGINSVSIPHSNSTEAAQTVYYTIVESDGTVRSSGTHTVDAGDTVTLSDLSGVSGDSAVASLGWTRKIPREFRLMYARTVFIPDLDETETPYDPPVDEDGKAGSWLTRPKSTSYKEHDAYGLVVDGGVAFVEGDAARFSGDNWNDGNVGNTSFTEDDPLMVYWDRQTESVPAAGIDTAERAGTATGGGTTWLEDTEQDWWGGTLYTHTGTATGGTTSTLIDTGKASSFMWGNTGTPNRFVGFILEITSGAKSGTKVPITSYTAGTQTIGFDAISGFTPSGVTYQIREPAYELNRWKDAIVRITKGDGSTVDVVITHNDDTRLYFAAQAFTIDAGMSYQIIRHAPGTVWLRDSGAWVKPTGNDARTDTAWPDDQATLLPTIATRYGRLMKGDYILPTLFSEMQAGINKLKWTAKSSTWTSRASAGTPEDNGYIAEGNGTGSTIYAAFDDALDDAYTGDWNASTENNGIAPQMSIVASGDDTGAPSVTPHSNVRINGYYAYGLVSSIPTYLTCSVDWLAYSQLDGSNSNEQQTCQTIPGPAPDNNLSTLFSAGGSPAQFRKWASYDSTGSSDDAARQSAQFNVDLPPVGNDTFTRICGSSGTLWAMTQGFIVTNQACILKWDMSYV